MFLPGNDYLSGGKYVWVGGFGCSDGYTEVYENGVWTAIKPYPKNVIYHCVTFLPNDDSKFYVIGGLDYGQGKFFIHFKKTFSYFSISC